MSPETKDIFPEIEDIRLGKTRLDEDPGFEHLLKGKSVVIVGPARTLMGQNQGMFIDSHDVVVRINDVLEHFPPTVALANDIGTRADIIYCNQVILRKNILRETGISHEKFFETSRKSGVRSFVCTNNSLSYDRSGKPNPSCPAADRNVIADFRNFLTQGRARSSLRIAYGASEALIRWLGGNWGRTGFVALVDLLGFDIQQLSVMGMTLYHGGGHMFAPESAELHPRRNRDGTSSISSSGQGHDSFLEMDVMRLLVQSYAGKLIVDSHLRHLLENHNQSGIHSPSFS